MSIPIIVISFNRLHALRRSIESYQRLRDARIVIHDTGSTFPPLLDYLADLQRTGAAEVLMNQRAVRTEHDLNLVAPTVDRCVRECRATHYVVTDPDIELDAACPPDLLELYAFLLSSCPGAGVIGPMLRIDDVPDVYPLKETVIARQQRLWHGPPERVRWRGTAVGVHPGVVDTTFGMYRAASPFRRLTTGFRTCAPYWARHLDWYLDPDALTDDQVWYLDTCSSASHWGGSWLRRRMQQPHKPFVDPLTRPAPSPR